jgi:hypothetical protein
MGDEDVGSVGVQELFGCGLPGRGEKKLAVVHQDPADREPLGQSAGGKDVVALLQGRFR